MGLRDRIGSVVKRASTRLDALGWGGSATAPTRASGTDTLGGWVNHLSGMGYLATDTAASTRFAPAPCLSAEEAQALYEGDGLAARVVDLPVQESLRQGWEVVYDGDEDGSERLQVWERALVVGPEQERGLTNALRRVLRYRAVFGGAVVVLVCADGRRTTEPLDREDPRLRELRVLTRHDVQPLRTTRDPITGQYNTSSDHWQIVGGDTYHVSRLLFVGRSHLPASVPDRRQGWEASTYERLWDRLRACGTVDRGALGIITQFITPVQRMRGLVEALAQGGEGLLERLGFEQLIRSQHRVTLLDADNESYEVQTTSVAGLPELMDRFPARVAAATGIPMTLLMGQSPAGLSTDDESGRRFFYDSVAANEQNLLLRPVLEAILSLAFATPWGPTFGDVPASWRLNFHPLYQLTQKEIEEKALVTAQRDQIYIAAGVLTAAEVRASRFSGSQGDVTIQTAPSPLDSAPSLL